MKQTLPMYRSFFLGAALIVAIFHGAADAQIKQWTDENGVTHFGNEQPAPAKPVSRELKIRKPEPFQLSPRAMPSEIRSRAEKYLNNLASDLVGAQLQMQLIDADANLMKVGASASTLYAIAAWQSKTRSESYGKLFSPIRSDLLSFEQTIKLQGAGALPDWVKDNRDWRALDKEFQR